MVQYNMMLAIARQPNRLQEALRHRATHWDFLRAEERVYGSLETRLMLDRTDHQIYKEAQRRLLRKQYREATWWDEHKVSDTKSREKIRSIRRPFARNGSFGRFEAAQKRYAVAGWAFKEGYKAYTFSPVK